MNIEEDSLRTAAAWLRDARNVVVFTGAGASAESGIPTFRDDEGFWKQFPPEEFANWRGIVRTAVWKPRHFAEFLHAVIAPIAAAEPNAGHRAVAELEKHTRVTVVTQNVDNLHQEAGSTTVREVHGTLFEVVTRRRRFVRLLSRADLRRIGDRLDRARRSHLALLRALLATRPLAGLGLRGIYRPSIVLFGEPMAEPAWTLGRRACQECDCLISVGTSRSVWPAATLPQAAKAAGACVIVVDPMPAGGDIQLRGTAAEVLPALVRMAFGAA